MTRRTPEQWRILFAEHQASGLTQAQFCQQQGLCPKYFSLRRRQLSRLPDKAPVSRFIQVQSPKYESAAPVSLYYHGVVIHFTQTDASFIADVAKALA